MAYDVSIAIFGPLRISVTQCFIIRSLFILYFFDGNIIKKILYFFRRKKILYLFINFTHTHTHCIVIFFVCVNIAFLSILIMIVYTNLTRDSSSFVKKRFIKVYKEKCM